MSQPEGKWRPLIIGLILTIFVSGIAFSGATGGGVGGGAASQSGRALITMANINHASVTVTFPNVFPSTPKVVLSEPTNDTEFHLPTVIGVVLNPQISVTAPFLATGSALTWTAMPVACCVEIFGDSTHQGLVVTDPFPTFALTQAQLTIGCVTASNTAGAFIKAQYSLNFGTTWSDLDGGSGSGKVIVDAANCGTSSPPITPLDWINFQLAPALVSAQSAGITIVLRLVGGGGGGIGDNPSFTEASVILYSTGGGSTTLEAPFFDNATAITTTGFVLTVYDPEAPVQNTILAVNWIACIQC